jgi:nucleoside-diphosphate-sugar epimerase
MSPSVQASAGVRGVEVLQHWREESAPPRAEPAVHALVTGASGFIGMHLAERLLAQGKRVRVLVRKPESVAELQRLGAEVVVGALSDSQAIKAAVKGVETVYHLAAMTSALRVADMMACNAHGARAVALACAEQSQPPVLVHVSSIAAAGPVPCGEFKRETDEPRPISNYGRSKLAGERAVAEFAGRLPITIVRPGIVFGPRNREMLPMFKAIKYANVHFVVGWNTPPLSLLHVDDCVSALTQAAARGTRLSTESREPAERLTSGRGLYFAVGPEYPDYAGLGRLIRAALRRPYAPVFPLMGPFPWIAAGINEQVSRLRGKPDSFNLDKIREARASSWACSAELAQRELGLAPRLPLGDRIAETVAWYRANRWL